MSEFLKPATEAPEGVMTHTFFSDPGHGWLEVKATELHELGIAELISGYSYLSGEMAYLEEDCDLSVFLRAKEARKQVVYYQTVYQDNTPIRYFDSYKVTP